MQGIQPTNLTAQYMHSARGNPPSVNVNTAISNCFPGLEFDMRNIWKNLFQGIEIHEAGFGESGHLVLGVEAGSAAAQAGVDVFARLVSVNGKSVEGFVTTPAQSTNRTTSLELGNALAEIFAFQGSTVVCRFELNQGPFVEVSLIVNPIFESGTIAEAIAEPGAMTQSLCSPWQADYRECGCYYWAASRPDFVNADAGGAGHDWMQKNRSPGAPYRPDGGGFSSAEHVTYNEFYQSWESQLKFIIGGKDSE